MFESLLRASHARRHPGGWSGNVVEALESRCLLSATTEALLFDFGTTTSLVEPGYTRVTHLDAYSETVGYGWLTSGVGSASRTSGTALTRDLNFAPDMTFGVDLADGVYDVTVIIGDTVWLHDHMALFLEGQQFDQISTAGGEVLTLTYTVRVSDGQLTLRLLDLGGNDPNAVINGLEIRPSAVDETGPHVVDAQPIADQFGYVSGVVLVFNEPIREGSFTVDDVLSLDGPQGAIGVTAVHQLDFTRFEVRFAEQLVPGAYTLVIGPEIEDLAGNTLDQHGEDQFAFTFEVQPLVALFDFGTTSSAVESGYLQVTPGHTYNPDANFGWLSGTVLSVTRTSGSALERDLNFSTDATFALDVADGVYEVTVYMGDTGAFAHDEMGVFLEGLHVDTVSTAAGQVVVRTYRITVADGQLTLRLLDLGGEDPHAVINGLEVRFVGFDLTGPRVVSVDPADVAVGSVDRITFTFDEAIREGTFTLEDVVSFVGPNGTITATAVNRLSETTYEVVFDRQFAPGTYTITIGPDIEDLAGNRMDQNQNGTPGEDDDVFTTSFMLETFAAAFDFGTGTSPVAAGFVGVTPETVYTTETGYGWLSGTVFAVDRTSGTELTRDLNFTELATFVVDVPVGTYLVTLTMGDTGPFAHDLMGVFIEGEHVDTVSTGPRQVVTRTYEVAVTDGQFTLLLDDLGGTDRNVVINGLELMLLAGGPGDPGEEEMSPVSEPSPTTLPAQSQAANNAKVPASVPAWTPAAQKFNTGSSATSSQPGNGPASETLQSSALAAATAGPAAGPAAAAAGPATAAGSSASGATGENTSQPASQVQPASGPATGNTPGNSGNARGRGAAAQQASSQLEETLEALDNVFSSPQLLDQLVGV